MPTEHKQHATLYRGRDKGLTFAPGWAILNVHQTQTTSFMVGFDKEQDDGPREREIIDPLRITG